MFENCKDLEQCEKLLAPLIEQELLLGEFPLTPGDRNLLAKLVENKLEENLEQSTIFFQQKAPASFACYLVFIGQTHYHEGDFWSEVAKKTGIEDSNWHNRWGKLVWEFLANSKLPCLPKEGQYLVGTILLHGGIPDQCIPQYFEQFIIPLMERELPTFTEEALREKLVQIQQQERKRKKVERELEETKNRINLTTVLREKFNVQLAQFAKLQELDKLIYKLMQLPVEELTAFLQKRESEDKDDWYQAANRQIKHEEIALLKENQRLRDQLQKWNHSHDFFENSLLISIFMLADSLNSKDDLLNSIPLKGKAEQLSRFVTNQQQLNLLKQKKELWKEQEKRDQSAATSETTPTELLQQLEALAQLFAQTKKTWHELEDLGLLNSARCTLQESLKKSLDPKCKYLGKELQNLKDKHKGLVAQQYQTSTTIITWLDEPVRRFILYSGKRGQKLIYNCANLLSDYLAGNEDESQNILPESMAIGFLVWWDDYCQKRGIVPEAIKSNSRPTFALNLDEEKILLLIPEVLIRKKKEPYAQVEVKWPEGTMSYPITSFYIQEEYLASEEFPISLPGEGEVTINYLTDNHKIQWRLQLPQYLFFSDENGELIADEKVPAEFVWLLLAPGWTLEQESEEEFYPLENYRCLGLDLSQIQTLYLSSPQGNATVDVHRSLPEPKLRGRNNELMVEGLPVWTEELPQIEIVVSELQQLEDWTIKLMHLGSTIFEENCNNLNYDYLETPESIRVEPILPQKEIPFGPLELGIWQRKKKVLRQQFYYLPEIKLSFSQPFIEPKEKQIQFSIDSPLQFKSAFPLVSQDDHFFVESDKVGRTVEGTITLDSEERELTINLPRVSWQLEDELYYAPKELYLGDWEGKDTILLTVLFPCAEGTATLYLNSQELKKTIKRGKAKFNLAAFKDTARQSSISTLEIGFSFHGAQRFPLMEIIGNWHVDKVRLEELPGDKHRLSWQERGAPNNRACRLWRFPQTQPQLEKEIPPKVRALEFKADLLPGPYLLEFFTHDPWQPQSITFPQIEKGRVFPIFLGPQLIWQTTRIDSDLALCLDSSLNQEEISAFCFSRNNLVPGERREEQYYFPQGATLPWLALAKSGEVFAIANLGGQAVPLELTVQRAKQLLALNKKISFELNQLDITGVEAKLPLAQYSITEVLRRIATEEYGREFKVLIDGATEEACLSWAEDKEIVMLKYSQGVRCLSCGLVVSDQQTWHRYHGDCTNMIPSYKPQVYPTVRWNYFEIVALVCDLADDLRPQLHCLYPDPRLSRKITTWELKRDWSQLAEELIEIELANCIALLNFDREAEQ